VTRTIAYLAGSFPLRSETFVYREVRALRERGWTVRTCSLHRPHDVPAALEDLQTGSIIVYDGGVIGSALAEALCHPIRSLVTFCTALTDAIAPGEPTSAGARLKLIPQALVGMSLARHVRGVEHIHCHFAHAPTTVGMYAARQLGKTFSFTGHANDLFQRRALLKRKLERAAFVSCISQWHRELYESIEPGKNQKYRVIRCGVVAADWERDNLPAIDQRLRVLSVCRLVEKKGIDTLIRALAELRARHAISWRLTVAGSGPDMARLAELANELNCADDIQWLGAVENERVKSLLGQADVFALPCRTDSRGDRDGIPVVLMEAMAAGVPVISGDLPAIRELIEDGKNGLLICGEDVAALADRLASIARDDGLRKNLSCAAQKRVQEEFSLAMNADRLEQALLHTIARSAAENDTSDRQQPDLVKNV
jgi:glycosyltransferase involved in cell wall biosynthesis